MEAFYKTRKKHTGTLWLTIRYAGNGTLKWYAGDFGGDLDEYKEYEKTMAR